MNCCYKIRQREISALPDFCIGLNVLADLRTDGARAGRGRNGDAKAAALQSRLTPASKTAKRVRIANGTSKPSRGTSVARDEQQSTETLSFRCCCERCRLMRGAVVRKHKRRDSVSVESE